MILGEDYGAIADTQGVSNRSGKNPDQDLRRLVAAIVGAARKQGEPAKDPIAVEL